ncbi:MAG: glycosyltransferase family 4 protein [Candidatus Riflebacteria bacterium]|jgi:glycosyltransferase involved in cell wall biosynthesis|nr:glycosyltransferase family 4 protein [Candidatus Riflebacteria bacterium]
MNQKPVVILLPYESCSGLELFGLRFAQDLQSRGYSVKVAAPAASLIDKQCQARGLELWPFPASVKYNINSFPACLAMLKQLDPSAVIAFRTQMMYPLHFASLVSRLHPRLFLFYRIGVGSHWRKDPIHRRLFRHFSAVVPNADYVGDKIVRQWGIDAEKVVCIKSGVDIGRYRPDPERRATVRKSLGIPDNAVMIGSSGRIHPDKGSEILLRAVFAPDGPGNRRDDVHLLYIGREYKPGYADHLIKVAAELGAEKRFHIMPFRNDPESVYSALDLFAFAVTSREAYAYVVLEAMASGVAAIVPAAGGMPEMYDDGVEGFFFTHNDQASLRQTLAKALSLPAAQIRKMGDAARQRIVENAEWGQMMEKYLRLFKKSGVSGF